MVIALHTIPRNC